MSLFASLRSLFVPGPVAVAAPVREALAYEAGRADARVVARGPEPPLGRSGTSGTRWSGWRPAQEEAPELRGRAWPQTARRMLRSDPKLAGIVRMLTSALLSARWEVEALDDSTEAQRNAEYVRRAFGLEGRAPMLRERTFEDSLAQMLLYLPVGYRVLEEVYYSSGGRVWLDEWADTEPDSIREWVRDDAGRLVKIQQDRVPGDDREPQPIDASQAIVLTLGQTGSNFEGVGMLRPCWPWWQLKSHVMTQVGIGCQRWAVPAPMARPSRERMAEVGYSPDEIQGLLDQTAEWLERYTSHETQFVVAPEGIDISTYGDGAYDPKGWLDVISHANQEMATAFVAQVIEIGVSEVGSRSIGEVHQTAWQRSTANILDHVAGVLGQTVRRLLGFNFYPEGQAVPAAKMPRLRHVGLDVDGLADIIGVIPALTAAGALTPTDELEARVLRMAGLREHPAPARAWADRLGRASSEALPAGAPGRPSLDESTVTPPPPAAPLPLREAVE